VPERNAAEIHKGMEVSVLLDAYPAAAVLSRVARMYPYLDDRMRARTIEIEAPRYTDLLPGMFARLTLKLETIQDAIVVPIDAIVAAPGGTIVFVVDGGIAVRRPVQTGTEEAGNIQIVSGLQAGEQVVTAGNDKLKDGVPVRVAGEKKMGEALSKEPSAGAAEPTKKSGDGVR
jgi:membrane fusion protein (multidrug efflux system)